MVIPLTSRSLKSSGIRSQMKASILDSKSSLTCIYPDPSILVELHVNCFPAGNK